MLTCNPAQFHFTGISLTVYFVHSFTLCQSCIKLLQKQTEHFLLPPFHIKDVQLARNRVAFILKHPQETKYLSL